MILKIVAHSDLSDPTNPPSSSLFTPPLLLAGVAALFPVTSQLERRIYELKDDFESPFDKWNTDPIHSWWFDFHSEDSAAAPPTSLVPAQVACALNKSHPCAGSDTGGHVASLCACSTAAQG